MRCVEHPPATDTRDHFVDLVRGASLVVVVVWHWAFTVFDWQPDGPHATSPIGFTSGMWLVTWLLQVMPLFFFVGGWANLSAWQRAQGRGVTMTSFITQRFRQLAVPALTLVAVWWVIAVAVAAVYDIAWAGQVALLVVSPLWFVASYLIIIALMPLWVRLHERFGVLVPVWLAGIAALVDVARFNHGYAWVGWLNMLVVWGLAHQLGFFYRSLTGMDRQRQWAWLFAGLFALVGLVWAGLYPASMVGVPGDKFSNMAPPSLAIVALIGFQVGALLLLRPWVMARMGRPRWVRFRELLTTYSLPLYLLHTTGMVAALVLFYLLTGRRADTMAISPLWWATRPLALIIPLAVTAPLLLLYGKVTNRKAAKKTPPLRHEPSHAEPQPPAAT